MATGDPPGNLGDEVACIGMKAAEGRKHEGHEGAALANRIVDVFTSLDGGGRVEDSSVVAGVGSNVGGGEGVNTTDVKHDRGVKVDNAVGAQLVDGFAVGAESAEVLRSVLGRNAAELGEAQNTG